ncbi:MULTISPECIES: sensor histidine kinase [unclassified Clostridium]|uniref:sensor histidine kinase n=1 Tax=unclassified Clostridium TaxID=2614128 RepID=UPI0002983D4F|nr:MULTISPECIES: sensor histidine kinase [unclassified Clostridium]EKQ57464.1 MAG: signal transduction histidine kinase [Clostridium sp. Maddingley MBC34-26]
MKFKDRILGLHFYSVFAIIAFIFIYHRVFENVRGMPLIVCIVILFFEIVLIWSKKTKWNSMTYICISIFIIAMGMILQYCYGVEASTILWPLIWAFGVMPGTYNNLSVVLAFLTTVLILIMSYTFPFPFGTLFNLVGVYLGIRSIRIRQEAYRTSQLHLSELNKAHRELQEAHAELQEASVYSMRYAALEERTRLAREIHDGIGHQLTSLIVQLQALEIMLPQDPGKASELVSQLLKISRQTMAEVRVAVKEWSDDEMGLGLIALKGLISQTQARSAIQFSFIQESEITEWPIEISIVLYRILQESLTNILRHSNAISVEVRIKETNDQVVLIVSDNGRYTENTPLTPGFGIKGIMERCKLQGGTCNIIPERPHGLRVEVILPIENI